MEGFLIKKKEQNFFIFKEFKMFIQTKFESFRNFNEA